MDTLCALYILADRRSRELQVAVTEDMVSVVWSNRHRPGKRKLVYFELCESVLKAEALRIGLKVKGANALSALVQQYNPEGRDLFTRLSGDSQSNQVRVYSPTLEAQSSLLRHTP